MKDFFERQDHARAATVKLVALFAVAVVVTVALTAAVVFGAATLLASNVGADRYLATWQLAGLSALGATALILAGTLYKMWALRGGGPAICEMLGGRPVIPNSEHDDERVLLNVVEEMAIASGVPVPDVYVLPSETGINAFAAGLSPQEAAIAVTQGTLDRLTRDELQGVIAHEFSHILNGDMRLNVRLMGVIHGIILLAIIGDILWQAGRGSRSSSGRRSSKGNAHLMAVGAGLYIVGWVGVFFGRMIKASVSRRREFLADASAVQFTRNPDGLAGALKKIGGLEGGSTLQASHREEASHFFFGDGVGAAPPFFKTLFASHPPLLERVRAIDGSFTGVFPSPEEAGPAGESALVTTAAAAGFVTGRKRARDFGVEEAPRGEPWKVAMPAAMRRATPDDLLAEIGAPRVEHVRFGAALVRDLPASIRRAAREPFSAQAVAYALVLDRDEKVRREQLARLRQDAPAAHGETVLIAPSVLALDPAARLPVADLLFPALRKLSAAQLRSFQRALDALIAADPRCDLFAYALRKMLLRHLRAAAAPARIEAPTHHVPQTLRTELIALLSMLAHSGHAEPAAAEAAFAQAAAPLKLRAPVALLPRERCTLEGFDRALDEAADTTSGMKERILRACAACISHDGVVTVAEAELVRAIADTLGVPIPPLVGAPAAVRAAAISSL